MSDAVSSKTHRVLQSPSFPSGTSGSVLKDALQNPNFVAEGFADGEVRFSTRFEYALKEALLALEKQEKLKKCSQAELDASRKLKELTQWLDKEQDKADKETDATRVLFLEEVRGLLE